jgi:WD40 repeat protein
LSNSKTSALHLLLLLSTVFLAACASPKLAPSPSPTIFDDLPYGHDVADTPAPTSTAADLPTTVISQPTPTLTATPTPEDAPVIQFPIHDLIHDLRWSPDGSQLAIAAGTDIHLYNSDSMVERYRFALGVWAEHIVFASNHPILGAAAKNGKVYFWDMTTGAEICQFTAHKKGVNSLAFQPGGDLLATTGTDIISRLWDISSVLAGDCKVKAGASLIGSSYTAPDVEFSADGQQFALVDIRNIYLRESQTRKLIAVLKSDLPIFDIALSPNGRWLAAAQGDATVALWDLSVTPKPISTVLRLPGSSSQTYVWRVDFSSDSGLLAGAASDGALLVWELPGLQAIFNHHFSHAVSGLAFKPNTRLLAVGALDGSFYIYQINR